MIDDERFTELRELRRTIDGLTAGHLRAIEGFRFPEYGNRRLSDLGERAASIPPFVRTMQSPDAMFAEQWQVGSTCAVVRSILRHPGVPYRHLRPLHLLVAYLERAEQHAHEASEGAPDPGFWIALSQIAASSSAIRQALSDLSASEQIPSTAAGVDDDIAPRMDSDTGSTDGPGMFWPRDLVRSIVQVTLFQVIEDLSRLRDQRNTQRADAARYSIARLEAISRTCSKHRSDQMASHDTGYRIEDLSDDALIDIAERVTRCVESEMSLEDRSPFERWLKVAFPGRLPTSEDVRKYLSESEVSSAVASHLTARCTSILASELPSSFDDLGQDRSTAHPFFLYWIVEAFAVAEIPAYHEVWKRLGDLVVSAREDFYRLLASAFLEPRSVDAYRLGFHLAIEAKASFDTRMVPHLGRPVEVATIRSAVQSLIRAQLKNGTWAKQDRLWLGETGEAYGFCAELLSTLLAVFGDAAAPREYNALVSELEPAIHRTVEWLDLNRVDVTPEDPACPSYVWATKLGTEAVEPVSWATGEAYSFLFLTDRYVSSAMAALAVDTYRGTPAGKASRWRYRQRSKLFAMTGDLWCVGDDAPAWVVEGIGVGQRLAEVLAEPLQAHHSYFGEYTLSARSDKDALVLSGILSGPPGTGKTSYAERLAAFLGWPLISLSPLDFLRDGMANVPRRAGEIFSDLIELRDCVVLFDEMEEFLRSRDGSQDNVLIEDLPRRVSDLPKWTEWAGKRPDPVNDGTAELEQRLWTVAFLPLLQDLRDKSNLVFLVATNYFSRVDSAIARPGRFDFQLGSATGLLARASLIGWRRLGRSCGGSSRLCCRI